jgi:hypothetical protein
MPEEFSFDEAIKVLAIIDKINKDLKESRGRLMSATQVRKKLQKYLK